MEQERVTNLGASDALDRIENDLGMVNTETVALRCLVRVEIIRARIELALVTHSESRANDEAAHRVSVRSFQDEAVEMQRRLTDHLENQERKSLARDAAVASIDEYLRREVGALIERVAALEQRAAGGSLN